MLAAGAVPMFRTVTAIVPLRPANNFALLFREVMRMSGNGSAVVNVTGAVVPPGVVTVTSWGPSGADEEIVKVAVTAPPEIPPGEMMTPGTGEIVVLPVAKPLPVSVTNMLFPRAPTGGLMLVNTGMPGNTVNVTTPLEPLGVATLIV